MLLYDGQCGLCNGVVRLMLRHDPGARMHFAPLQSLPGQDFLRSQGLPTDDFDSLVFVPDWNAQVPGGYLMRTDGALAAFGELGGGWGSLARLRVIPRFLRDPVYRCVAGIRYAVFGAYKPAPLPDPAWEKRFLAR